MHMQKTSRFGLLIASIVLSPVIVHAQGMFAAPSARANGMGVAYIAIADDPSAIYWNPAGLAQLQGSGMEISGSFSNSPGTSNRSVGNSRNPDIAGGDFPLPNIYTGEEANEYSSKKLNTLAPLPFLAAYSRYRSITLAAGVYAIGGGGGYWKDTVPALGQDHVSASIDAIYYFITYNLSAATELYPGLYAGIGADIITMSDSQSADKNYLPGASSQRSAYHLSMNKKASGYGIQCNGGLLYRVSSKVRVGAVARTGSAITMKGRMKLSMGSNVQSDYEQKYVYPATYGFGAAYDPIPALTFAAGLDRNIYSAMRNEVTYKDQQSPFIENINTDAGWKDTTLYRVGAEYRTSAKLALRAGVQTDPSPLIGNKLTLLDINKYDMVYYSVGAGYSLMGMRLDLCYIRAFSDKPETNGRTYDMPMNIFMLGMNTKF